MEVDHLNGVCANGKTDEDRGKKSAREIVHVFGGIGVQACIAWTRLSLAGTLDSREAFLLGRIAPRPIWGARRSGKPTPLYYRAHHDLEKAIGLRQCTCNPRCFDAAPLPALLYLSLLTGSPSLAKPVELISAEVLD